ncbi:hypothetical protein AYR63_16680 (plasmid) [Secundilactobacillus paracollinoides]|uniref:Uncharacterized protein n=1 Tax=Secundilactobacillus paracollinoides TaxID=240427 RepID=A0A1B2J389_9LACO|nr:hypothetical protein AYR63_16680 [Secundilactobacillus paracollinoides]MBW0264923.1 hypothetical protein [Lentilactobacillus parabuchneri]
MIPVAKEIVPVPTTALNSAVTPSVQPACQLTVNDKRLTVYNDAQPAILEVMLRELNSND